MTDFHPAPGDRLVAHATWITALARELVGDPHTADDLAQETLKTALESGPKDERALKSWLRKVLRNLSYERLRRGASSRARERESSRPESSTPPTDDLVERMQTERRLTEILHQLEEPYQSTLFLRFYDDLPPREIARRQGVPVATVKSRLHRGLASLRTRLDGEYGGDGRAWLAALLPLAAAPLQPEAALTAGGLALNSKIVAAAAIVSVMGGLFVAQQVLDDPTNSSTSRELANHESPAPSPTSGESAQATPEEELAREPVVSESVRSTTPAQEVELAAAAASAKTLRGQVLDGEGQPVAGLDLRLREESGVVATSSAAGSFEFETAARAGHVEVADEQWVTVRAGAWSESSSVDPVVVAAPSLRLAGTVVDEWGSPLTGARVGVSLPANFETRFHARLDASSQESFFVTTGEDGRFLLERVPSIAEALLRASHTGYEATSWTLEGSSNEALVLELARPAVPEERALRGVVLRRDGSPATEAHVSLGASLVPTTQLGEFTIDLGRIVEGDRLLAIEAGSQPASLEAPGPPSEPWPDEVTLILGEAALSIRGVVLDASGEPQEDARIWLADGERFGVLGNVPLSREALMAGAPLPREGLDFLATGPEEDGHGNFGNHSPMGAPNAILHYAITDADGRFELTGLADREYTLHVLGPELASGLIREGVTAGASELELRMDAELVHPRVAGRVTTRAGAPVAGVRVHPYLPATQQHVRLFGGSSDVTRWFYGEETITDENGRFEFRNLLKVDVEFYLSSDEVSPTFASIEDAEDPLAFDLEVVARIHATAELAEISRADELAVFDASGEALVLLTVRASGHTTWERIPIVNGRTETFVLTSEAAELRLLRDGETVESHSLKLVPGELNVLRY